MSLSGFWVLYGSGFIACLPAATPCGWEAAETFTEADEKNRLEGEKHFSTGEHAINSLAEAGRHGRFVGTRQSFIALQWFTGWFF